MSNIQQKVMASVLVIYLARKATGPTALKCYALVLSLWGMGRLVWVSKVVENFSTVAQSGVLSVGNFVLVAVEHAHISVQLMLAVILVAGVWLLLDLARAVTPRARLAA